MPDRPAPTIRTSRCSGDVLVSMARPVHRHGRPPSRPATPRLLAWVDCKDVDAQHKAGHDENLGLPPLVIRGLDPRIHLLRKMDCRVSRREDGASRLLPGNDETGSSIPIMIALERAFRLHADVFGLVL